MISRGRSVRNSKGLAGRITKYLHHSKNEQATFIQAYGTAFPNDLEKSLDQMIMMGELSKSDRPLYQAILSPDLNVDKNLTDEEWERMRQIQAEALKLQDQPYIEFEHVMNGRKHRHYFYQRYDPETGRMVGDEFDYKAHAIAREKIEIEFGHERTFQPLSPEKLKAKQFIENIAEIEEKKKEEPPIKEPEETTIEYLIRVRKYNEGLWMEQGMGM